MRVRRSATLVTAAVLIGGVVAPSTAALAATPASASAPPPAVAATSAPSGKSLHQLSPRLAVLTKPSIQHDSIRRQSALQSVPASGAGSLERTASGRMIVTVRFAHFSSAHVNALKATGAHILARTPELRQATATVAINKLETVADLGGVQYVGEVLAPQVNATCDTTISGGDSILKASNERTDHSVTGAGVTVGILSDSYANTTSPTSAAQDVTSDNLPGTTNTCGHTNAVNVVQDEASGGEDEGRAMAQTVHDLAPGAKIAFATAFVSEASFATNIKALATAGAKVIADDVSYFDEPFYQEGTISEAIDTVKAQGVDYFSSSANNSLQFSGHQVGSYEAVNGYRPISCPASVTATGHVDCHNFNPSGSDNTFGFTASGDPITIIMQWAEPFGGVNTDLDLYLLNSAGTIVATSNYTNPGAGGIQEPFEFFQYTPTAGQTYSVVVGRRSSASPATTPRFKLLFAENGYQPFSAMEYSTASGTDVMGPTVYGHNGGASTMSVGASSSLSSSPSTLEPYSSYGPVTWLYNPVPSTTALGSATVLAKPDIVASDCAKNTFFGSFSSPNWYFCGTSDAAPHAAAAAALLWEQVPSATAAQINTALESTAVAMAGATTAQQGSGLINIDAAGGVLAPASSSTALSALPASPVTYGTSSNFTAQITSTGATPTGNVTFNIDSGAQTNTVALSSGSASWNPGALAAGTHSVKATYNGDGTHATSNTTISFVVNKANQTISYTNTVPTTQAVGTTWTPAATGGGSGNAVTFTVGAATTNSACSITTGVVSFNHVGSCVINADQAGSSNYNAATQVVSTISVTKGSQAITFTTSTPSGAVKGGNYTPTATGGGSGNTVTFTIDAATTNSACSIGALNKVTFNHAGSCVVDANQAGNTDYNAAPQVQQTFTIGMATGTITFTSTAPGAAVVGGATYTPTATGSGSSAPIVFSIGAGTTNSACTIAAGIVSFAHVGSCVVKADQAADSDYNAATASQTFSVGKGAQAIVFTSTAPGAAVVGGTTYTPTANGGGSGNAVTFSIDAATTNSACTFTSGHAVFAHVGTCVIDANQASGTDYNVAPTVTQSFGVGKGAQTISLSSTPPASPAVGGSYLITGSGGASGNALTAAVDATTTNSSCTVSGLTVTFMHVGSCVVDVSQAGNTDYNAASSVQQSMTVGKGAQTVLFTSTAPASPSVGTTYTPTATGGASGNTVTFSIDASTTNSACSFGSGHVSFDHAGSCVIDANQAGNTDYNAATTAQQTVTVGAGTGSITFTSTAPAAAKVGGATYTPTATGSGSSQPLVFSIGAGTTNSACSIASGIVSFAHVGSCVVQADQAGDTDFGAATASQTFSVGKGAQTVAFTSGAPIGAVVGDSAYTPTASGGASGNAVTFTIDAATTNSACTFSSGHVNIAHAGSCVIDANQLGNTDYNAATQVQQSFTIGKGSQTVAFSSTAPVSPPVGQTYVPTATGGASGNAVTFTIDAATTNSACTFGSGHVTFAHAGSCVIDANQLGNSDYNAANQAQQTVTVVAGTGSITFTSTAPAATVGGATYTPTANGSGSSAPIVFSIGASTTNSACTIAAGVVSFAHVGSCVVQADQAGDTDFGAATASQTFPVGKGSQTVAFTSTAPSSAKVGDSPYTPTASSGGSGNAVTFTIDAATTNSACTFSSGHVNIAHAGSCVVDANQAGSTDYNAASQVQQTFTIGKGSQSISFSSTAPASPPVGGSYVPTANGGGSGNTVTFSIDASTTNSACTFSSGQVNFNHAGSCVVDANQLGNSDYNAANQAQQTITVVAGTGSITFTSTAPAAAKVGGATYTPTANGSGSSAPIVFSIGVGTTNSACSIASGVVSFAHVGSCVVQADQAGDTDFGAATASQTFSVGKGSQTVAFTSTAPASAKVGDSAYTPTASSGASGNAVTFTIDAATTNSACSFSSGHVNIDHAGSCVVDANQLGNTDYNAATQVQQTFTIGKAAQTINLTSAPPASPAVGGSYLITGSGGGSGNALVATVDATTTNSACTVSGLTVSFANNGLCVIDVNQAGNADYNAASQAQQSMTVGKTAQAIVFGADGSGGPVGGSVTPTATGGASGNPVMFTIDPSTTNSACTINLANLVSFNHAGSCVVAANQAGDATYAAAPQVTETFTVTKAAQTVNITSAAPTPVVGQTYSPTATGGASGNAVTFSVDPSTTNSACTVNGAGLVTFGHAGNCVIAADQAGSADYSAATTVTQAVAVSAAATHLALSLQATTVSAHVTVVAPGAGTPTGTVTFFRSGVSVGTAPLSAGTAVLSYVVASGDEGKMSASYAGTADFTGSSDSSTVTNPTITATVVSAAKKTKYGWYRTPVGVSFTCTPTSAPLVAPGCPTAFVFTKNGAGQHVTKTIHATDGGIATVTVSGINLDRTKPKVKVKGVKNGKSYAGKGPKPSCSAKDKLSGIAKCKLKLKHHGHLVKYKAVATDRAGNKSLATGSYRVAKI